MDLTDGVLGGDVRGHRVTGESNPSSQLLVEALLQSSSCGAEKLAVLGMR